MKRAMWLVLPLLASAAAAACQGKMGETPNARNSAGSGNGTGSATGGADGTGGTAAAPPGQLGVACAAPALGSPLLRLLTSAEFSSTIADVFPGLAGAWQNSLPANSLSAQGFANDASAVVGPQLAQALLDTATAVATAVTSAPLANLLPCSASSAGRACADTFVTQYGRRLFRRALSQVEHDRYLTFFDGALAKSDFKTALKWVTVGLIQSPNAIYKSEIGAIAADGSRSLTPVEVATELAYTYTGSTPTDALLQQAESGTTLDALAQAKAMLATDAGKAMLQHFFEAYLSYPQVASVERSNIANFAGLRSDMVQETHAFIDQIVFQGHGGLKDLLTASSTNPSAALATYYGFPAPGSDYASVARSSGRGIGLLAQGSILASRALPTSSSPTQRGLLVFSRLLCNIKPTPPPNVPPPPMVEPGKVTTRERYEEQHASSGACAGCHKLFDPIGFGFEHFDEGGKYRADESGLPINTVSDVPKLDGTPLFSFQDEETLASGLADQAVVYQCFASYLATYAFGTPEACLGSSRVADLNAGTLGIADYFAALAAEPHFVKRAAQ